jgi:NAD(P)-dependent dehydrogenase (short-subunit alcohol dehydrogenase family)
VGGRHPDDQHVDGSKLSAEAGPVDLSGRVCVVAGASAGIGLATATRFAAAGATVVMLARGPERLAEAAGTVGADAVPIVTDIADPDSVRAAFAEIADRFGRVDVLLNVAGVTRVRWFEHATDEDIAHVMGVNLLGPMFTTRSAIPLLDAAGGGVIVNVSSEITLDAMPMMTLYGTSKAGLEAFTRAMNRELRDRCIRVCTCVVGSTATSFGDNFSPEDIETAYPVWLADGFIGRVAGTQPMDAQDVAEALFFQATRPPTQMLDVMHVRAAR